MSTLKTSPAGIALIKRNEGCKLTAYLDTVADPPVWSIGYGDTLNVHEGMQISQQEAEDRLASRLAREFEPGVLAALQGAPVTQSQFDAMVSLAWNIGVGAFTEHCSVPRLHRAGKYSEAANAFRLWNKAGGVVNIALTRRREEERALYLSQSQLPTLDSGSSVVTAVKGLQSALAAAGCDPGPIDGIFGRRTQAAMEKFQQ